LTNGDKDLTLAQVQLMFSLRSSLCLVFTVFLAYQLFRARFSSEKKYTIDTLSILISLFYVVNMFFLLLRDTLSL
jgi:hypothetical protein